jgi:hypothetical protein
MLPTDVMRFPLIFGVGAGCSWIDAVNLSECYHETAEGPDWHRGL